MTIEVFQPVDPYVIAGTGPYNIGHPYGDNDEFVVSVFDGTNYIQLDAALWSISPESSDEEGDLTLDAATATTYAGNTMYIVRRTVPEQGWEGINGEREKGLEVQLDYLTMTVQDMQGQLDKGLFGLGASSGIPVVMVAGRVPIVSPDGSQLIAGPTADQITDAQGYAQAAETAQGLSEDARDASVVAQGLSEDARDASVVAQGLSEDARDASVVAQGLSEDARDASVVAQGLSEDARDASVVAQGLSEDARDASVVAQGLSEDARDASVVAQGLSEDARDASVVAQGLSEDARDASVVAQGLSEDARDASQAARDKAEKWADEAEDTEVETGQFSAKHWAAKAAANSSALINDPSPEFSADLLPDTDDAHDFGSATKRIKDMFFSGGLYLGGTGADNYLDDYEKGTWTPSIGGANQSETVAGAFRYERIGDLVFVTADFTIAGGSGSNFNELSGLPFSVRGYYHGFLLAPYCDKAGLTANVIGIASDLNRFDLYAGGTNRANLNNGDRLIMSAVYLAD